MPEYCVLNGLAPANALLLAGAMATPSSRLRAKMLLLTLEAFFSASTETRRDCPGAAVTLAIFSVLVCPGELDSRFFQNESGELALGDGSKGDESRVKLCFCD